MRLRTVLPLLEIDSSEVIGVTEQQAEEYQSVLSLAQKACIQSILQKVITSAKLKKIYVDEKCISIEIQRLSINFSLNLYLFQFATSCGKMLSNLAEINIGRDENPEEIVLIIKETISSKTNALMVGFSSETLISQILKEMKEDHKILSYRKGFVGDDIAGKDFFFSLRDIYGREVETPLQIKTSKGGQIAHQKKLSKIPSIVISENDSREDIIDRILKIGEAYVAYCQNIIHL
jgi:hypothetical protein